MTTPDDEAGAAGADAERQPIRPEQYQLIGQLLRSIAPPGSSDVVMTLSIVGPSLRSTVTARLADGRPVPTLDDVPLDLERTFFEIHRQAYVPGAGSWFTARVVVLASGRITVDLDDDHEPPFAFAPASWEVELDKRPRTAGAIPAWLAAKLAPTDDWWGIRWQLSLTADGLPAQRPLDATTTPQGHAWLGEVARRLTDAGVQVRLDQDEGEDTHGQPSVYDELHITIGEGYMSLACFAHELSWIADVFPDQCDQPTATRIVRTVITVVTAVTGYEIVDAGLASYERRLLGR